MNEAQWLACEYGQEMLNFLRESASDRKLRLFAVACCRRIWRLLTDERSRNAIEVAEQYADRLVGREHLIRARDGAREAKRCFLSPTQESLCRGAGAAQDATRDTGRSAASNCLAETSRAVNFQDTNHCNAAELHEQAILFRCIFGNPFRPFSISQSWLAWHDSAIRKMAQAIYDHRTFDLLPLLADALEDAGCEDAEILSHCRSGGEHVRGCWVVDLLLGKK